MAQRWKKVWIIPRPRKRGSSFQVVYHDRGRSRRHYDRSFRSERLAKEYARKLELFLNGAGPKPELAEASADGGPDSEAELRSWDQTTSAWVDNGPRRQKTRDTYRLMLKRFAKLAGPEFVEDVTEAMVSGFLVNLRDDGRSAATTAAYLRVLAAFFRSVRPDNTPVTRELVARWRPYKDRKRARPHFFTPGEFQRMLQSCDLLPARCPGDRTPLWWKTFISVLYECGLRLNEAAHLIWHDIDFEASELRVAPHANLKGVAPWRPKGKALRTLPMPTSLVNLFTRMHEEHGEGVPYVFLPVPRYVQMLQEGFKPGRDLLHSVRKGFVRIRDLAGIPEGMIHDMRRTFVTNWLRNPGMSPEEVQILAGHEDIQTTLSIYSEVNEAEVVAKAKRIIQNSNDRASSKASTVAGS